MSYQLAVINKDHINQTSHEVGDWRAYPEYGEQLPVTSYELRVAS